MKQLDYLLSKFYAAFTRLEPVQSLVRISLVFTQDLMDPVRIGSAIWHQMGPLMKGIPHGTVPFQFRTVPV